MRPPGSIHRRCRRRGPRSNEALLRRSRAPPCVPHQKVCSTPGKPLGSDLCESKSALPCSDYFSILNLNVHGFISHRAELEVHIALLKFPLLISITETFFKASIVNPTLTGYVLVSRLDRRTG